MSNIITLNDVNYDKMIHIPNGDRMFLSDLNSDYGMRVMTDQIADYLASQDGILQAFHEFFSGVEASPDLIVSCIRFPFAIIPQSEYTQDNLYFTNSLYVHFAHGKGTYSQPTSIIKGGHISLNNVFPYGTDNFATYTNTKIQIYIPFVGNVDIAPTSFLKDSGDMWSYLHLLYIVDYMTGEAIATLLCSDASDVTTYDTYKRRIISGALVYQQNCIIGTQWNFRISRDRMERLASGMSGISGLATTIAGVALDSPGTIMAGVSTMAKNVPGLAKSGNVSITANAMNSSMAFAFLKPIIRVITDNIDRYTASGYAAYKGRPFKQYVQLDDVSGFTIVDEIHLEGFNVATSEELDMIETLLKEGVILGIGNE